MEEFITEAVLVSAYDIHYNHFSWKQLTFPEVIFLDSGGYEARVEHDLSEAYGQDYRPKAWTEKDHRHVVSALQSNVPVVLITYDSPRRHSPIEKQVTSALKLKHDFPNFIHEVLIKPDTKNELIEPDCVKKVINELKEFSIIGFTEHELDNRIVGRMEKIAAVRRILDAAGISAPIHVFGSLDSFSAVLYFLSGAEIFDGLTWLRFGFHNGQTIYRQNYGAIRGQNGILKSARELSHAMWVDNYYYLEALRDQMRDYVRNKQFTCFKYIGAEVESAIRQVEARLST